jgi:hypothetical protein
VAAADVVLAASSLAEMYRCEDKSVSDEEENADGSEPTPNHSGISLIEAFNDSYDCLGMRDEEALKRGIQSAINLQKVSRATVYTFDGSEDTEDRFPADYMYRLLCGRQLLCWRATTRYLVCPVYITHIFTLPRTQPARPC